ncbi:hypothetical protein CANTEDRAFT_125700 [Yamadazyma tenuis ATCC 10573]|uniref:STAS domain-containing protein n=2 Tax=Candida tenuis TaxID=2315449 RepID=G3BB38_CANTC|nr:uncharacterized protein CANTEDRAFT_125700 [Yamadazyma tenuis ATCC 10573]EGV62132.1 hypothetical protein CANTEDRAFT_125700 [Yamadazyma tenuis ATCC 10573]
MEDNFSDDSAAGPDFSDDSFHDEYVSPTAAIEIQGEYDGQDPTDPGSDVVGSLSDDSHLLKGSYAKYFSTSNPFAHEDDYGPGTVQPVRRSQWLHHALRPVRYIPAVFLGTLLNILDGLSYGMIMFPVSEPVFAAMGPSGLSMFYVSCIVSQLVYSLGGSAFRSGIGSEMIEVTPFFHAMASSILAEIGNGSNNDTVIATTIVTYAISSVVTGLIFYVLGKLKLGSLVGFFPRHILVGCIGGVGYFLVVTGIQVSSRLDGEFSYHLDTFRVLFGSVQTFLQWFVPFVLTAILIAIQTKYHNSLIVPMFFIGVFVVFHVVVAAVPWWSLSTARVAGWVFPSVDDDEPWYGFYEYYRFGLVDWWCIVRQIPTMLALTFFGILHVPINVPALAVTVNMDQVDVDRELVAHGYSNVLSGLVGSIQNYLVYTNSVLFIRAGADDRLAGVLLAVATAGVMMVGPVVIGFIPVCVVGSLIYLLGYELLKEALYDTRGRLTKIEYYTIIIIVVVMGAWDFVYGVLAGILLACLSFVVEAATTPVVQGIYTGVVARSTVLRHPKQQEFLKDVGNQICVVKLQGTLFFGSIGGVEASIRSRFEVDNFKRDPVKFLILDMKGIVSIDFSACEGFRRILNLANEFETQLIISSVVDNDETVKALRDAGLWDTDNALSLQLFSTLNYALEWCESSFLATYKNVIRQKELAHGGDSSSYDVLGMTRHKSIVAAKTPMSAFDASLGTTPRTTQVYQAATRTVKSHQTSQNKYFNSNDTSFKKQPLPLLMLTFQGLSDKDAEFWSQLTDYFVKEQIPENFTFYDTSTNKPAFFIVETGLIKSLLRFESDETELHSSILPMTAFGDLFEVSHSREISYTTVSDSVAWKLSQSKLTELLQTANGYKIYNELLIIQNKLTRERFDTMTANLVIS